LYFEVLISLL